MSNLSRVEDATPLHNIYNVDPSRCANIAPIRTVPKDPIHPVVRAKKKSPSPTDVTKTLNTTPTPRKQKKDVEKPLTMKEKNEKLSEYKAKKAQAEQMLLIAK